MNAHENPFRASQTDDLSFISPHTSLDAIWTRFRSLGHRAGIVGPHGTGKTTLVESLCRTARAYGMTVAVTRAVRKSGRVGWENSGAEGADLRVVDGFELLPFVERLRFVAAPGPLLVTSHRKMLGLRVLYRTASTAEVLHELLIALGQRPPDTPELRRLLESTRGNVREVFRRLYDEA